MNASFKKALPTVKKFAELEGFGAHGKSAERELSDGILTVLLQKGLFQAIISVQTPSSLDMVGPEGFEPPTKRL